MELTGEQILGFEDSHQGSETFTARDPSSDEVLEPEFYEATAAEVDRAVTRAAESFPEFREIDRDERVAFLREVAGELDGVREGLIDRAGRETALTEGRLDSELDRTINQIRMFADLVEDGSWVEARIDTASDGQPDVRRMLVPLGPVGVFGASNFPLAFSVAGGDTASALAAGNPVVVKGHPGHPGTCERVARAIREAVRSRDLPEGVFSMIQGTGHNVGQNLVKHPELKAVGFTGSLQGGRALYDAAASRPDPIPVFAEMGSTNPVFLLPGALEERGEEMAGEFRDSVNLGVGQFCTNPGILVGKKDSRFESFAEALGQKIRESPVGTMLHEGIAQSYDRGTRALEGTSGVTLLAEADADSPATKTPGCPRVFRTDASTYLSEEELREEVFGPSTLLVECDDESDLREVARQLRGHLTATIRGTEEDLTEHGELVSILERKVGRLLFNGVPTGVRVSPAMQHGGPYPATTDARFTSVGTAAIKRFARPVCYQDFPRQALPPELTDANERGIWRMIDGERTREDV